MFILAEKSRDYQFDISLKDLIEKRSVQYMICELLSEQIIQRPKTGRGTTSGYFSVKDDRHHRYSFYGRSGGEMWVRHDPVTGRNLSGAGRKYVPDDQVLMIPGGGRTFLTAAQMEESLARFADHVRRTTDESPYAYTQAFYKQLVHPGYWYPGVFDRTLERIHVLTFARERYSYIENAWEPYDDVSGVRQFTIFGPTLVIGKGATRLRSVLEKLNFVNLDCAATVAEARRMIVEKPSSAESYTDRSYPIILYDQSVAADVPTLIREMMTRVSYEITRPEDDEGLSDPLALDILLDRQRVFYVPSLPADTEIDEPMLLSVREYLEKGLGLF